MPFFIRIIVVALDWLILSVQQAIEQKLRINCAVQQKLRAPATRPKLRDARLHFSEETTHGPGQCTTPGWDKCIVLSVTVRLDFSLFLTENSIPVCYDIVRRTTRFYCYRTAGPSCCASTRAGRPSRTTLTPGPFVSVVDTWCRRRCHATSASKT